MKVRSIFERRFRRPVDDAGGELLLDESGEPWLVIERGHAVGYRCTDGSVRRFPERRIEELPDTDRHWVGGEGGERWIE